MSIKWVKTGDEHVWEYKAKVSIFQIKIALVATDQWRGTIYCNTWRVAEVENFNTANKAKRWARQYLSEVCKEMAVIFDWMV